MVRLLNSSLAALLLVSASAASAHVPFLKPSQFEVVNDRLQIESSFTEFPFQADFAMDSPQFTIVAPDGKAVPLSAAARTKVAVYVEPLLSSAGSYRVSTGVRKGPTYRAIDTGSKLYFADDMKRVQGRPVSMQYFSRADVYLFKDDPAYTPRPFNRGAEIVPLTSPHRIERGDILLFQVLRDGYPVPRARVVVVADNEHLREHRKGDLYDVENERANNIVSDERGRFSFSPRMTGLNYLFVTIHQKLDADTWASHNAGLTLQVNLPAAGTPGTSGATSASGPSSTSSTSSPLSPSSSKTPD